MVAAALSLPPERRREPLRARVVLLILIVLIHLGLLIALLTARSARRPVEPPPTVVRLITLSKPAAAPKPKATPKAVSHPQVTKAPIPIVKVPPQPDAKSQPFRTEMFDAVDIAKLPSHKGELSAAAAEGSGATGTGTDADRYGEPVGSGPHGEKLYDAEWYRRPTDVEINPYLPKHLPEVAAADIMCRTIDHWGVEDCQELGESPLGTGLSRAIRQAGWQFKVKPVRLGQKFEVGTWVRIHYTITTREAAAAG